jgi:two-component system, OmpR family, response regulator protein GraR
LQINSPSVYGKFISNNNKSAFSFSIEKEDNKVELTKNEYKILEYLVLHRQQVISRDEIMDYLWESEEFVDDNTLNVNIKRLRTKLEELGLIDQIETRRGQGYLLK